ncbi:MAG TPA: glycosyltransferase family 87 protein [Aliidongia sp.]|uniref:glycosyltransferase family 87 protein n=1 Tax=Aliidongia sp. TaxID=1914230 RepID=UPI002DDDAEBE|nr:glycosyltransferase family 87 protein [Aliidongia sp.]HEV2678334.1 glycosyltransferase family 87 protein [Aliidongia sp.]
MWFSCPARLAAEWRFTMSLAALRTGAWATASRIRRLGIALFLLESLVLLVIALATYGVFGPMNPPGSTDFISFYAAGDLANRGMAPLVYDQDLHQSAVREIFGDPRLPYYYFFYPPVFLLLCQMFALLPYLVSFALWVAGTAALCLAAIRRILPAGGPWLLFATFPCLFWTVGLGQNALLTAGLLGFATLLMDRRPLTAGALLALIAYKPHFLLLVPVALLSGRRWPALGGFVLTLALLAALTTLVYGPGIWTLYGSHTDEIRHIFEFGRIPFTGPVTSFAAARVLGASLGTAYAAQAIAALAAAIAVGWLWAHDRPPTLRFAALAAAMPLAAPVVLFYDLMPLAIAIAWLAVEIRRTGTRPWEMTILAAVWLLCGVAMPVSYLFHLPLGPLAPALVLGVVVARGGRVIRVLSIPA